MSDVIISGYYGLGNSGDEALLCSIVRDLRSIEPNITITALSASPSLTHKLYGIKTVNRYNLFAILKEFKKAKILLSGGGTLIQDATSTKSLLYYLGIIYAAKKMGLKVMLYANGMGPIKDKNIKKVKRVLNGADLITLRENISLEEIKRCEITLPYVEVTADPAFNLEASSKKRAEEILKSFGIEKEEKLVAVSLRSCKNMPKNFAEDMAYALDEIAKKGYLPVFIPMQTKADLDISVSVSSKMKYRSKVIDCALSIPEMLAVIGKCTIACGMRLHMLIFASVMSIPMAGIAYDPKVRGFMEYLKQKTYTELENFKKEEFANILERCTENSQEMSEKLKKESVLLKEKAKKNAHMAIDLLKKGE